MTWLAHSAKNGIPAEPYRKHIERVTELSGRFAAELEPYAVKDGALLRSVLCSAASLHDLGKLDTQNQAALQSGKLKSLPVHHQDAGAAYFLQPDTLSPYTALLIRSHHIGYPDFTNEANRGNLFLRDETVAKHVDNTMGELLERHRESTDSLPPAPTGIISSDAPMLLRIMLSCLADADHTGTAVNYGQATMAPTVPLRPAERLAQLDRYVASLPSDDGERSRLRRQMYEHCRDAELTDWIASCDSPVGSGKTTAVMAHLLKQAAHRGLRRIFVVLPYTNIIEQSVAVYRKALVLPGEDPEEVVAELHHKAAFESEDIRHLTALWRAPIIVTTAVGFFETLAACRPAELRRLHELPGSAVFVDEAHAAVPVKLLPLTWHWMNVLANEWKCYWVLASGSLSRFWQIEELASGISRRIPEIADAKLRQELAAYETGRISYRCNLTPLDCDGLADLVMSQPGPRIVIMNTVQSAAGLALHISRCFGRECVEHLSTALTPNDRAITLERVQNRLKDTTDCNWVLVATSYVEAGMDFSFRTGFREIGSLLSLLQAAGRVNRNGGYPDAVVWSFCVTDTAPFQKNPGVENAAMVLKGYLRSGITPSPGLSTQSIQDELRLYGATIKDLLKYENQLCFKTIEDQYNVIDSNAVPVIIDPEIAAAVTTECVNWKMIQQHAVQINEYRLKKLNVPQIAEGLYRWSYNYDNFIGYMAGLL